MKLVTLFFLVNPILATYSLAADDIRFQVDVANFHAFGVDGTGRTHPEMKYHGEPMHSWPNGEVLRIQYEEPRSYRTHLGKIVYKISVVRNVSGRQGSYILREESTASRVPEYYCLGGESTSKRLIFYRAHETAGSHGGRQMLSYVVLERGSQFVRVGHGGCTVFSVRLDGSLEETGEGGYHPVEFAISPR